MDLSELRQPHQVLVYPNCQYCIRPSLSALTTHLRACHKLHPDILPRDGTDEQRVSPGYFAQHYPTLWFQQQPVFVPSVNVTSSPRIVTTPRLAMLLVSKDRESFAHAEDTMSGHFQARRAVRTTRGGRHAPFRHLHGNGSPIFTHIYCQRFFATEPQSSYSEVTLSLRKTPAVSHPVLRENARRAAFSGEAVLHKLIDTELNSSHRALEAGSGDCQGATAAIEVDPWLDATW
jgi:hypothetical protein